MVNIVLHCSDSSFGNAALIGKWHVTERKWSGIGYHYVILNGWISSLHYNPKFNGHIETGRPLDNSASIEKTEIGAHVKGFNSSSIGICLIGKSGQFTEEQLYSALELVYHLEKQFNTVNICQHSDLDSKKPNCAGLDMETFKSNLEKYKTLLIEYK